MAKHPAKLDLGDYLPYLANRVGTIIAEQFGAEALSRHGLSIAEWRVLMMTASEQWRPTPDRPCRSDQHRSLDLVAAGDHLWCTGHATRTRSANSNREVVVETKPRGQTLVAHASLRSRATTKPRLLPA